MMRKHIAYILTLAILVTSFSFVSMQEHQGATCHDTELLVESACCKTEMDKVHQSCENDLDTCDDHKKDCCKDQCCCFKLENLNAIIVNSINPSSSIAKVSFESFYSFSFQEFDSDIFHPPIV